MQIDKNNWALGSLRYDKISIDRPQLPEEIRSIKFVGNSRYKRSFAIRSFAIRSFAKTVLLKFHTHLLWNEGRQKIGKSVQKSRLSVNRFSNCIPSSIIDPNFSSQRKHTKFWMRFEILH